MPTTLKIVHVDELYVLQEALEAYRKKLDAKKAWRTNHAAKAIEERLEKIAQAIRPS